MGLAPRRSDGWKTALERPPAALAHRRRRTRSCWRNRRSRHHASPPARSACSTRQWTPALSPVDAARHAARASSCRPTARCFCSPPPATPARAWTSPSRRSATATGRPCWSSPAGRRTMQAPTCATSATAHIEDVYRAVDSTLVVSRYSPSAWSASDRCAAAPVLVASQGVGCAEVMRGDSASPSTHAAGSLDAAIDTALQRWREGRLHSCRPRRADLRPRRWRRTSTAGQVHRRLPGGLRPLRPRCANAPAAHAVRRAPPQAQALQAFAAAVAMVVAAGLAAGMQSMSAPRRPCISTMGARAVPLR